MPLLRTSSLANSPASCWAVPTILPSAVFKPEVSVPSWCRQRSTRSGLAVRLLEMATHLRAQLGIVLEAARLLLEDLDRLVLHGVGVAQPSGQVLSAHGHQGFPSN